MYYNGTGMRNYYMYRVGPDYNSQATSLKDGSVAIYLYLALLFGQL